MRPSFLELNGEKDHVHLLVSYPPQHSVAGMVNSLKGVSSRRLKEMFPEIESFWSVAKSKNSLWSPSYFASSTGEAPIDVLKTYIQDQNRPDQPLRPPLKGEAFCTGNRCHETDKGA